MAWAAAQTRSNFQTTSSATFALAYTSNVVAGNLLVAAAYWGSTTQTCALTDSQVNTWTIVPSSLVTSGALRGQLYTATAASSAANTVTMTCSGTNVDRGLAIFEGSGFNTASPVDANTTGTGTVLNPSINLTVGVVPSMMFAFCITSGSVTAGAGYTDIGAINGNDAEYKGSPSTGAQAASFVGAASTWGITVASLKEAAAAAAPDLVMAPYRSVGNY